MAEFTDLAQPYVDAGLSPVPIEVGTKKCEVPQWSKWADRPPTPKEMDALDSRYEDPGVALVLGTKLPCGQSLIAIDVDEDAMVEHVVAALGTRTPSKTGKKGTTIFVRAEGELAKPKKLKHEKGDKQPSVERLGYRNYTVIPPTVHPETREQYYWDYGDLLADIDNLVELTEDVWEEIRMVVEGYADPLMDLNTMTVATDGQSGNTHVVSVTAAGWMVARKWSDERIHARIVQAEMWARDRASEAYDWPNAEKEIQEWIDSAKEKGFEASTSGKSKATRIPIERVAADWAVENLLGGEENLRVVDGVIRTYGSGFWSEVNEKRLRQGMLREHANLGANAAKAACEVIRDLYQAEDNFGRCKNGTPVRYDVMAHRVCLQNVTVNVTDGTTYEHSPEHELIHQLPFDWDPEAECQNYNRVSRLTFDRDDKAAALWDEYCAHTLVPDMNFQKMLFLVGPGGNGKGTMARVLSSMHDPSAVGSVSVTDLGDERKRTSLIGKLLNISGEQSYLKNVSDVYLKRITGGDPVDCRRLYGEVMPNIMLNVRFLEMTNEMPSTTDSSEGLRRRLIILNTPNKVKRPDHDLDAKLAAERPGILVQWVEALGRLYTRGKFEEPFKSKTMVKEYVMENDPVAIWVNEMTKEVKTGPEGSVVADLYTDFNEWAKATGWRSPPNIMSFGKSLNRIGVPSRQVRLGDRNVRVRLLRPLGPGAR